MVALLQFKTISHSTKSRNRFVCEKFSDLILLMGNAGNGQCQINSNNCSFKRLGSPELGLRIFLNIMLSYSTQLFLFKAKPSGEDRSSFSEKLIQLFRLSEVSGVRLG